MEIKKLTEGALLSAMQVVLGLVLMFTGIGYSLYIEIIFPITVTMVYLRCGARVGLMSGLNALVIIAFCFGDVVGAIYMIQSLGFGLICGYLICKKGCLQDDLMYASLIGCLFLLVLDALTAGIVGVSLLNREGMEIFYDYLPNGTEELFEVFFYMTIASVPIATVLMTYVGGLLLGHRMGMLRGEAVEKYRAIRYFKLVIPHSYHSKQAVKQALIGILVCAILWPIARGAYSKALIATSGMVLMYFVLTDLIKLISQYLVDKGKNPGVVSLIHLGILILLFYAFKIVSCVIIIIGCLIDFKKPVRLRQEQILKYYLLETKKLK